MKILNYFIPADQFHLTFSTLFYLLITETEFTHICDMVLSTLSKGFDYLIAVTFLDIIQINKTVVI